MDNPLVRRAIAHAIDRERILEHIFAITLSLSTALQSKGIDLFSCCDIVVTSDIVEEFATIFNEGSALIKKHEIPITSRGARSLGIGDNAQVRIRENVFKPFLE